MDLKGLGKALAKEAKSGLGEIGGLVTKGISALGEGINKGASMASKKFENMSNEAHSGDQEAHADSSAPAEYSPPEGGYSLPQEGQTSEGGYTLPAEEQRPAPATFKAESAPIEPPVRLEPANEPVLAKAEPEKVEELPKLKVMSSRNAATIRDSVKKTDHEEPEAPDIVVGAEAESHYAAETPEAVEIKVEQAEPDIVFEAKAEPHYATETPEAAEIKMEPAPTDAVAGAEAEPHYAVATPEAAEIKMEPAPAVHAEQAPKVNRLPLKVKTKVTTPKPVEPVQVGPEPAPSTGPSVGNTYSLDHIGRITQCSVCGATMHDGVCQNCERNGFSQE